jgi:hypothetical protein
MYAVNHMYLVLPYYVRCTPHVIRTPLLCTQYAACTWYSPIMYAVHRMYLVLPYYVRCTPHALGTPLLCTQYTACTWYSPIHGKLLKKQTKGRDRTPVRARPTVSKDLAPKETANFFLSFCPSVRLQFTHCNTPLCVMPLCCDQATQAYVTN